MSTNLAPGISFFLNRAFAATWSPLLPKPTETLIDLELTEFLDIPIKKIEARKFSYAGMDTRIVGHISQTVQCVVNGKTSGTIHLKASVVRHLTKMVKMDCIAGGQLYQRLSTTPENVTHDLYSQGSRTDSPIKSSPSTPSRLPKDASENSVISTSPNPSLSSPSYPIRSARHQVWAYQCGSDDRYDANNDRPVDEKWAYDDDYEMWGLPYNLTGLLAKPEPRDNMVTYIMYTEDNMNCYINVVKHARPKVGQTFPPTILTPIKNNATSPTTQSNLPINLNQAQTSNAKLKSIESLPSAKPEPTPPQLNQYPTIQPCPGKLLLHDLVFCGHHDPCLCLPGLSQQQAAVLPPHCLLYLPRDHPPCGTNCGTYHVHKATPGTCNCVPPIINKFLDPPDWFWEMFPSDVEKGVEDRKELPRKFLRLAESFQGSKLEKVIDLEISFPERDLTFSTSVFPTHSSSTSIHTTKPKIQNVKFAPKITPDVSTVRADLENEMCDRPEIEMCNFCGENDDACRCEDLYFRLKTEQENYAEM